MIMLYITLQVDAFSQNLRPHQKAVTPEGMTVLEKAVLQHNLLAASRLYNNIYFEGLGQLLGVAPEKAERIASKMVAEKRLLASSQAAARCCDPAAFENEEAVLRLQCMLQWLGVEIRCQYNGGRNSHSAACLGSAHSQRPRFRFA